MNKKKKNKKNVFPITIDPFSDPIQRLENEHIDGLVRPKKKKAIDKGQSSPSDMFCFQQKGRRRRKKNSEDKREKESKEKKEQTTAASSISHYIEYSV